MADLRQVFKSVVPELPEATGDQVYARFNAEPDTLSIPVVNPNGRPVGLIERNSFILRMAAEHGRALYARRPISRLMDDSPLVVDVGAPVDPFIERMLTDRPSDLLRGFIVSEGGRYLGVGTALELLKLSNDLNRKNLESLKESTRNLSEAVDEIQEGRNFLSNIIENIPAMVFVKRLDNYQYILLNRAGETILGYGRDEMIGKTADELFSHEQAKADADDDARLLCVADVQVIDEDRTSRLSGARVSLRTKKIVFSDAKGRRQYLLGISEDVTESKRAQAQIAHLAHYDILTDLPNRALFKESLQAALARSERSGEGAAVLCVDLDHFKTVNDTLGHPVGDALLQAVASRLRSCVREDDSVARLGGDEFAIVQSGARLPQSASHLAARVVEIMSEPFQLNGHTVVIGASVGVALSPTDSSDPDELLKMADMALYRAKAEGRGGFHFFEKHMDERLQTRRQMELDLRRALVAGEFELHFQPLMNLRDDRVVACEALVRWRHPVRGLVSPAEFIPLAEEIGLIVPLGDWVLREACRQASFWPDDISVAVNISAVQFRNRNLVASVFQALSASGVQPNRLELEITESVMLENNAANLALLHQLRELGVRIAMDDFGTGYSSLSYLRSFPFDKIKIDQSFVRDLPHEKDARAIIKAMASIGASLGMSITAEGVETQAQLDELRLQGCDQIQGYLISRPVSAEAVAALLGSVGPQEQACEDGPNIVGSISEDDGRPPLSRLRLG
jgi:diguanylate cyclase (GGDEF)-like protein/PAS domain S-box-containing protein